MLLLRLRIRDFLIYESVDLDLTQVKLTSIIGQFVSDRRRSNGAGKTALLEAIRYALYDQTRSKTKAGIVRHGARNSQVDLEFMIDGKRCRVQRHRTSDGTSSAKLLVDGRDAGDKIKVVNDGVISLIGVDAELFDQIYFFKQGDQFGFTEANPSDRKAALAKVFKMDSIGKCVELAKQKKAEADIAYERAESAINALKSQVSDSPTLDELRNEEFEISSQLASATQVRYDYDYFTQDNIVSKSYLDGAYTEFSVQVANDLESITVIQGNINQINAKIAELQQVCQTNTAQANDAKAKIDVLNTKIARFKTDKPIPKGSLDAKLLKIGSEIETLSNNVAVLDNELKKLKKIKVDDLAGKECNACKQFVTADHVEHVKRNVLGELAKVEGDWSVAHEALQRKKIEYIEVNKLIDDAAFYHETCGKIDSLVQLRDVHLDVASNNEKTIDIITEERNALFLEQSMAMQRTNADRLQVVQTSLSALRSKFDNLFSTVALRRSTLVKTEVDRLTSAHADILKDIKVRAKIDSDIEANTKKFDDAKRDRAVYAHLVEAFGKNGMQALMIENAIGVIETFTNDILKQMHTKFMVALRTQKETKAGDMRESLDIIVYDNGAEKAFENYSGGERALVNIALRLALSRVVGSLHGVRMQSLFLDEVLGSLDAVNREEVVKVISYLSRSFEQVFIVSHTDEIKDVIDSAIVIERHDDKSTIRLTHA